MSKEKKDKSVLPQDDEIKQILSKTKLPEKDREIIMRRMGIVKASKSYSGPLPPPEDLREYEHIQKGAADRIIVVLEKQVEHRIEQESKIVDNEHDLSKRGQYMGFVLCLFFGGMATYLGLKGHDVLAGVIVSVLIIAIAVIFVLNQYPSFMDKRKEY